MRSVRARVTVAAVLVAALALGAAALALALAIPRTFRSAVETRVGQAVQWQVADARRGVLPAELTTPPRVDLLQIVGQDGQVLGSSPEAAHRGRISTLQPSAPGVLATAYTDLPRPEGGSYYIAAMSTQTPKGLVTVYAGEGVAELTHAIRTFYVVIIFAVPVLLLLVALAAWTAVGMGLRPVERIRARLAEITGNDLSGRVPEPGTGDEIAALAATTNDTLTRLENSARTQRRFIGDASHELRSPVTALTTELDLALSDPEETDWPRVGARSLAAAERLSAILDELLMMARLNAGVVPDRRVVDLAELAREQVERRGHGRVPVVADLESAPVVGSPIQLDRLLTNLLDNAVRHAATRVSLAVHAEDGHAVVTVTDDGNGIAPEDRERVFERFTRLKEGRERDQGGSGLGLALSREIATAHHGTLVVADHTPGARFVARFPLGEPE